MTHDAILWPMIALVGITVLVWFLMYVRRIAEMQRSRIHPQSLATAGRVAELLKDVTAADNLRNLFEVPVLFYALCLALFVTGGASLLQLGLAWLFVALRALHSLIHVTYNRVMHRFLAYVLSCLCLFTMWLIFALSLLGGGAS